MHKSHGRDAHNGAIQLCDRVLRDVDALAKSTTGRIRAGLPEYEYVPETEHRQSVLEQLILRLTALRDRRDLSREDLERAANLAERRASQGVGLDALISAYHLGDREIWRALCDAADEAQAPTLPALASHLLESLHEITQVLAESHAEITRAFHENRVTILQRLVTLLAAGESGEECRDAASALGLSEAGHFRAVTWHPRVLEAPLPRDVDEVLQAIDGKALVARRQQSLVFILQDVDVDKLELLVSRCAAHGLVAVGLERDGLPGAAVSLREATVTIESADMFDGAIWFEESWAQIGLMTHAKQAQPMTEQVEYVVRKHPPLAETIIAYAESGLSPQLTGKSLHIHPNTVAYRLRRWNELTGWDPTSFLGLVKSWTVCQMVLTENEPV